MHPRVDGRAMGVMGLSFFFIFVCSLNSFVVPVGTSFTLEYFT